MRKVSDSLTYQTVIRVSSLTLQASKLKYPCIMRQTPLHGKLLLHRVSKFIMLFLQDKTIPIKRLIKTI